MNSLARDDRTLAVLLAGLLASAVLHAALLTWAGTHGGPDFTLPTPLELQFVPIETVLPRPPPQPALPPKPRVVPPPVKLATPKPVAVPAAAPAPAQEAAAPPSPQPVLVTGILRSSVAPTGSIPVPIGNTPNGPMLEAHSDAASGNAPASLAAAGNVNREPTLAEDFKAPYPDEARRAGVQGTVRLRVLVGEQGQVLEVQVLSGPGHGLDEAAREAVKRFRFRPAMKDGRPVPATTLYKYTFTLD